MYFSFGFLRNIFLSLPYRKKAECRTHNMGQPTVDDVSEASGQQEAISG